MSDLLRALPKVDSTKAPVHRPPSNPLTTPIEDGSSSDSSASTTDSVSTLRPSSDQPLLAENPWHEYFSQELYLESRGPRDSNGNSNGDSNGNGTSNGNGSSAAATTTTDDETRATYHVYLTPPANPTKGPLFICHHGAGASGMSFATFARAVRIQQPEAGVLSLEARGHGSVVRSSTTSSSASPSSPSSASNEDDYSISALEADALEMIKLVAIQQGWASGAPPPCVLVGHSLGGAVATHIAASGALGARLVGFAVLDVVCLLYTSPSPRDGLLSRMPSSA